MSFSFTLDGEGETPRSFEAELRKALEAVVTTFGPGIRAAYFSGQHAGGVWLKEPPANQEPDEREIAALAEPAAEIAEREAAAARLGRNDPHRGRPE